MKFMKNRVFGVVYNMIKFTSKSKKIVSPNHYEKVNS